MEVKIGVSNHHVHLSEEDYKKLFGSLPLEVFRNLVQTGQFASCYKVSIKTSKNRIDNVRLMGPLREYTQVEVSKTDAYFLGINPPVRDSGDLSGAEEVTIVGPCGEVTGNFCILANRHLHINHDDRVRLNLINKDSISIKVGGLKSAVLNDVNIKETLNGVLEVHLDTDDANANLLKTGDSATIIL